jgi:hypothetical protein
VLLVAGVELVMRLKTMMMITMMMMMMMMMLLLLLLHWSVLSLLLSLRMLVSMSGIAMAVESMGVICAVLISGVLITVTVAVIIAYMCKFVKVSIKGRAYLTASIFIPFLLPIIITADDSGPFSSCASHCSVGALGLAVTCGCSLASEIDDVPIAARHCWCCGC